MYFNNQKDVPFEELKGKTITKIEGMQKNSEQIKFYCSDGSVYVMYHIQYCCESVTVDDVYGDVKCLIGYPVVVADKRDNVNLPSKDDFDSSYTWTFYTLATQKGYVDIRWYGTSNGYYSEEVDFVKIEDEENNSQEYVEHEGYKRAVDKAVTWLIKNADDYTWYNEMEGACGMIDSFIEDFKKYMESDACSFS